MTTTTERLLVPVPVRLDFDALAPLFSRAMSRLDDATTAQLDDASVAPALRELVRLRASQINGCAYCVDMHAVAARREGVSPQTVDAVAIWRDSGLFTSAERAALALTEEITRLSETHVREEILDAAVAEHGEEAAGALVGLIVTINAWNAIGVTTRCWTVQPRPTV